MTNVIISFGGNQGDIFGLIDRALVEINKRVGTIVSVSPLYESEPWGFEAETNFINGVVEVETNIPANEVLCIALEIESELGRMRTGIGKGYSSRPMDLDIIDYGGEEVCSPSLVLPHPRMQLRKFVLLPLKDICPSWVHPVLDMDVEKLIDVCEDNSRIKKVRN
ncbi:2-amino-4-hydroxy-6-hydroxymethyldihydropteridine diphosphokinase [Halosquirtibacter xylanolyticus]|uniref:2-amino-4-hydroxy-6- hydroxymethyldihydropteridine diphosphokinase n=1 Tax=Halosquirtibacter xylanolyticus TaxID=3374599 RepID=UPI0037484FFD|nr:2-amino-4-hydroxy-6-hydroxymethyldihydropteridine diphosphokinase [Prolixibacteraceae bacterium]